jgi:hypothetical protein
LAPSLYEVLPQANRLPRSLPRTEIVPAEAIVGTVRMPSNTTADLLPLPHLRGKHWRDDWRRVLDAHENLAILPPVDLIKVDTRYFVIDGHKRAAAARRVGGVVDAVVVELHPTAHRAAPRTYGASAASAPITRSTDPHISVRPSLA